ncbi:MAG: hypothetical protein EZS28_008961 [Streblomastix strix]|uniref:Uncharacterized protein n=1 Tax=Streblomastix strix TaxID=222440 RepID=A0A5J4WKS2_9EUKA|nr:MAG: hypothetical protein EZS28_008961 [Streblomastix strix]
MPSQMTMITDTAPSGKGSTSEKELEMIVMAHGTWNKRYAKLSSNNREIKAKTQGLRGFAKVLKNSQITHLAEVKNEIADALSRLLRAGDYKLKENIFQQTCLHMNLNPTIDLFSRHFNNLLPGFLSTIIGRGKIAFDTLNQVWKKDFPQIHPAIRLLVAVLKNIREEQIEAMIIVPLWPGLIQNTDHVNENVRSLKLGLGNEILEPGSSLINKNLKLLRGKICCFLMDRKPGRGEDSQERF